MERSIFFLPSGILIRQKAHLLLGTNALVVSPPDAIPFRYGSRSSVSHLHEANEKGIRAQVMKLDSLSFDIDTNKCLARAKRVVPEIAGVCV